MRRLSRLTLLLLSIVLLCYSRVTKAEVPGREVTTENISPLPPADTDSTVLEEAGKKTLVFGLIDKRNLNNLDI